MRPAAARSLAGQPLVVLKGLPQASIRDDNPVILFEHKRLYSLKGSVGDGNGNGYEFGRAAIVRPGMMCRS